MSAVLDVYNHVVHKDLLIRRVNVTASNLVSETEIPEEIPEQLDMFTDYEAFEREKTGSSPRRGEGAQAAERYPRHSGQVWKKRHAQWHEPDGGRHHHRAKRPDRRPQGR